MIRNQRARRFRAPGHLRLAFFALCLTLTPCAQAEEGSIAGDFAYTGDWLVNAAGGRDEGAAFVQNIDAAFEFDLEQAFGISNGTLLAYFIWNDGSTFSDRYTGDAQANSNIDAGEAFRLYEFWYQHAFSDNVNLRVGFYDLNTEFDWMQTSGLFLSGSHGIAIDYGQTGLNGPSIFPNTGLAARLHWQLSPHSLVRYGLLDAVPADAGASLADKLDIGGSDGVLHALEFNHTPDQGARFAIGGFAYSKEFDTINQSALPGSPRQKDSNGGIYALVDAPVYQSAASGFIINAFLRIGRANENINVFKGYVGTGAVVSGFSARRPDDLFGLAVASARTGADHRNATGAEAHETNIELTYSAQVSDWLRLQPNIQYVVNPSANPLFDNAFVVGVRLQVARELVFR